MIQEAFLHFVWKNQYFNKSNLRTEDGQLVSISKTGFHNKLAGPDFKEAELRIAGIHWAGSVEVHVKSSDWYLHQHQNDPNYDNVILHLVYEHDRKVFNSERQEIPTVSLKGLIKPKMLDRYQSILRRKTSIPCGDLFQNTHVITRLSMLERALIQRLEEKSRSVLYLLSENNFDWEETTYQWLAKGFGFKTNALSMMELSYSVPSKFLRKHADLFQIEAILLGASGLLNVDFKDKYINELKEEYMFLRSKYDIQERLNYNEWHFSGVRPGNYPTVRIAQFAALLAKHQNLFSLLTEFIDKKDLSTKLEILQSEYWRSHVIADKATTLKLKGLTETAKNNLFINTTAPLLVAFSKYHDKVEPLDKAINLLISLPSEKNRVTKIWGELGWNVSSAFDSQGLLELHNEYCMKKDCVNCSIGAELIAR